MNNLYEKSNFPLSIMLLLAALLTNVSLTAQTFPGTGFTLPAGKTITITYEVNVNTDACPSGSVPPANISNQASVSGSNFSTVLTDDPDIAGASNPTLTPFGSLTLGNLVFNDLNRNGVFDGSDVGINSVALNLYLDNGDNVLTVADGAPVANTTTAGGGLYSFNVCPGSYIVEIAPSNFMSGGALFNAGAPFVSSPTGGAPDPDNNVDNDDNGDPVSGFGVASQAITISASNNTLDFGFKTPTSVSIADNAIAEGTGGSTTLNLTVTRNDNSEAFSLTVNTAGVSATSGTDFTAISGGTVSFTAGGSLMATIPVSIATDDIVENNETFTVTLSGAPSGVVLTDDEATGTINNDDNATLTLIGGTNQNEGNAGNTPYTFTATLSAAVQGGFQIAHTTGGGNAMAVSDYTDNDGILSFAGTVNEMQSWTVNVIGDNLVELDETFEAGLGAISMTSMVQSAAITIIGSPQISTITNDDMAIVALSGNVSQNESVTPQVFSVTLSNPVDVDVSVELYTTDGSAQTTDNDYIGISGQTVTFTAGTTTTQMVNVTVPDDGKVEDDEFFHASLQSLMESGRNVNLGTATVTGTILNDDMAIVALSGGGSVNEGNTGPSLRTFTATLSAPVQGGFTVAYTTNNGTATDANNDYDLTAGGLVFTGAMANEMKTFDVPINGDNIVEADESFTTTLGIISGTTSEQAANINVAGSPQTLTLLNDEIDFGDAPDPTYPTLLVNNGARHSTTLGVQLGTSIDGDTNGQPASSANGDDTDTEGDDEDGVTLPTNLITSTMANITVNASTAGFLNAWVDFNSNGSWADAGEQIFTNQALVMGNNALSFLVPTDATPGTSFARFRFTTASGAISYNGLADDGEVEDYQVEILSTSLSVDDVTMAEGNSGMTTFSFTVSLNNPAGPGGVTFDIATQDNTATDTNNDYEMKSLTGQTIPHGQMDYTFDVMVNGDGIVEPHETFFVNVTNVTGAGVSDGQGMGTITNDDSATLTLTQLGTGMVDEGTGAGTTTLPFRVTLSNDIQGGVMVDYETNNGTAMLADLDYTDNDGTLNFAGTAGEFQDFDVTVTRDNKVENDETIQTEMVALSLVGVDPAFVTFAGTNPQTATIKNDDLATLTILSVSQAEGNGGGTTDFNIEVELDNPVQDGFELVFNVNDGTATDADDFDVITVSPLTFAGTAGEKETIVVRASADNKVEAHETVQIELVQLQLASVNPINVTFPNSPANSIIQNDDSAIVTLSKIDADKSEGNGTGTTDFIFRTTLDNPVQGGFSLDYQTNDGTATTADNDYNDNHGNILFTGTANEMHDITTQVVRDNKIEADETIQTEIVQLNLSSGLIPGTVTFSGSPQTGTIINDELDFGDAPDPTYPTLLANNGARHALSLGGVHLGFDVDGDTDGQPSADANGDDNNGNDDENGVTFLTAILIGQNADISVNASGAGTLSAWIDFNGNGNWNDAGEALFPSGQALVAGANVLSFPVPPGAQLGLTNARFRFTTDGVVTPTGLASDGEVEDYTINIVNTQFSIDDVTMSEGSGGGPTSFTFTVSRSNNSSDCSVDYATTAGNTATSGTDFTAIGATTLNFLSGGVLSKTVTVNVSADNITELDESFFVNLSNPTNGSILDGQGEGIIENDDASTISIQNASNQEGNSGDFNQVVFHVVLDNAVDVGVNVTFASSDGTAMLTDGDYAATGGILNFTGNANEDIPFAFTITGDDKVELDETVNVLLSNLQASGRDVTFAGGNPTESAVGTILNDDQATISISNETVVEGDNGIKQMTFDVSMDKEVDVSISLDFQSIDGTAEDENGDGDYQSTNGTLTFDPGDLLKTVPLTINGDCKIEPNEQVQIELLSLNLSGRDVIFVGGQPNLFGDGTIENDDALPVLICPGDISQNNDVGVCEASVTLPVPTPSSVCGSSTLEFRHRPVDAANAPTGAWSVWIPSANNAVVFDVGRYEIEWQITDGSGSITCNYYLQVNDDEDPVANCPANITVDNDPGLCGANVAFVVTASDNCPGSSISCTFNSGDFFNVGTATVNCTATDVAGNMDDCSFTITVEDNELPILACTNITISLNANGETTIAAGNIYDAANSSDNCGTVNLVGISKSYFNCQNEGANTVTLTANDGNGNQNTCNAIVTVNPYITNISVVPTPETCAGAGDGKITASATASGGQVKYSVDGGINFQAGGVFTNLSPGTYTVIIKVFGIPNICEKTTSVTVGAGSVLTTWYKDSDGDGYSDGNSLTSCTQPNGYIANPLPGTDCDDYDAKERPGQTWYKDSDNDGYTTGTTQVSCLRPTGYKTATELVNTSDIDCNDTNAAVNHGATEICNNIDDDCDGQIDEGTSGGLTYTGNVAFTTQAQLNAWSSCYSIINGNVTISGSGINNLGPLSNITEITGNLTIQSTSLTNLNGLSSLTTLGGSLTIFFNSSLTTLNGLGNLATVGAAFYLYYNFQLNNCCAVYGLINGGVTGAVVIFYNKVGCNSVAEINNNCAPPPPLVGGPANGVAIGQSMEVKEMTVFPNPAKGAFTVVVPDYFEKGKLQVLDITGRAVLEMDIASGQVSYHFDRIKFAAGVYLICVKAAGQPTQAIRLIVE